MSRSSAYCMRRQAGFSLTELMVAITIGLIILGGTLQVFSASKSSFNLQAGVSRAQESGRVGMYILGRTVRHAGFYRNPSVSVPVRAALFPVGAEEVSGTEGGGANPDTLVVRFQSHEDGTLLDCHGIPFTCLTDATCAGNPVNNPLMGTFTFSLTAVSAETGTRSLQCSRLIPGGGVGPPAQNQPLLEGVSDFQVQYGEDTSNDLIPDRFRNADTVGNWNNVVAVRVMLTTNSVDTVGAQGPGADPSRIQQLYTETIYLRD